MSFEPWMLLAGNEVAGIAGLAGVVVVSQAAITYRMLDALRGQGEIHARERAEDRQILDKVVAGQHAAVNALQHALDALGNSR